MHTRDEVSVSVVIGSYNRKKFLRTTIDSVRKELLKKNYLFEIIVIDGGSTDRTMSWLSRQKDIITIIQHNRDCWNGKKIQRKSWGYFMNLGFKIAKGKYVCMLSDDCLLTPGAIINGINLFEKEIRMGTKVGAITFYFRDWPFNKEYYVNMNFGHLYVNHGLYLTRALKEVNYIDEEGFIFYGADIDLCLRLLQYGYACLDSPSSFVEHFSHANIKVRKTNNEFVKCDTQKLIDRWKIEFGQIGGHRIFKKFIDKNKTAEHYWGKYRYLIYARIILEKILKSNKI